MGLVIPVQLIPATPQMCPFLQGSFLSGHRLFSSPGVFASACCLICLVSCFSRSLEVQHGPTSSRKPSRIRCLDSGSHSPGFTSTLGGSGIRWVLLVQSFVLPGSHVAVSPRGGRSITPHCLSQHLASAKRARRRSTDVGEQRSNMRSLCSRPITSSQASPLHLFTSSSSHGD